MTERTKALFDISDFYEYPTHFEGRSSDNITYPYFMII